MEEKMQPMTNRKQLPELKLGMSLRDRDRRYPTRTGQVVALDSLGVTVEWNTGKRTRLSLKTAQKRFDVTG
jgi:hypothetical protein